jgi:hypothetical protein
MSQLEACLCRYHITHDLNEKGPTVASAAVLEPCVLKVSSPCLQPFYCVTSGQTIWHVQPMSVKEDLNVPLIKRC